MSLFRDFLSLSFSKIPSRYQEVEYIGVTDGDSYIDLDYIPTVYTKANIIADMVTTDSKFLIGSNAGWQNGNVTITTTLSSFGSSWTRTYMSTGVHNYVISKDGYYIDNVLKATYGTVTYIAPFSLFLFANDQNGEAVEFGKGKIYSLKLYENDVLTGNYIPCYRKSDNQIGLYDLITKKFCLPAGEGIWIKGNNIIN